MPPQRNYLIFAVIFTVFWMSGSAMARERAQKVELTAFSYHLSAPFVVDETHEHGWVFALANQIERLDPELSIQVKLLPRPRLDRLISDGSFDGMVVLVDPHWFNDPQQLQFEWSIPLINDRNLVVSRISEPVDFRTVSSLSSRVIGGVRGYRYDGIDFRVKAGWIRRTDVANERDLLRLLKLRSVDAIIISELSFLALNREDPSRWFVASRPQQIFERRILMSPRRTDIHRRIHEVTKALMKENPHWYDQPSSH